MRRIILLTAATLAVATLPACKRQSSPNPAATIEEEPNTGIAAIVHVADPKTAAQLLRGFHPIEQNAWRWTMQHFSVALRTPVTASNGAVLQMKFAIPDPVIDALKKVTINTSVNGIALPPVTFDKGGDQVYSQQVPAAALTGESVTVDFALEKIMPPGTADQRELGVVVTQFALEPK